MKKIALSLLTAFALTSTVTFAQGRGGGQRGGGGMQPGGQGQGTTMHQGQQGSQTGSQPGQGTMQRDRIHATDQQRDQLHTCNETCDQLRTRARDLAKSAQSAGFNAGQAREARDGLREQLRTMQQEHERLMNGFSAEQKEALQNRIRNMDRLRERVNKQFQQMDAELNLESPSGRVIHEHAREIEKDMKQWQKEYRKIQGETGA